MPGALRLKVVGWSLAVVTIALRDHFSFAEPQTTDGSVYAENADPIWSDAMLTVVPPLGRLHMVQLQFISRRSRRDRSHLSEAHGARFPARSVKRNYHPCCSV